MKHAVLLMAYGSPTRMEDVMEYLGEIYEGKEVPQYAIDENTKKYAMFGGKSPSNAIVQSVAEKLSLSLSKEGNFRVFLGNKHWNPSLDHAVSEIEEYDPEDIIGIPLFPFPSDNVETSYTVPLSRALESRGLKLPVHVVNGFNEQPRFIDAWEEVLSGYVEKYPEDTFFLFSAHSLPTMRNPEDRYRDSFFKSAENIAERVGMKHYAPAFQSRGKYGKTWLEPSVYDAFKSHRKDVGETLVAVPLGFIYDHLEILYDLDYEFGGEVRASGKNYVRTELPNDSETYIACLGDAVRGAISRNK